ncbi:MAG: hypothetical protein HQL26_03105, partial [Candidatus Omnitrophica bacterium]|nr:hypothetical protein [Candidatus Omnitrophota bacterium]
MRVLCCFVLMAYATNIIGADLIGLQSANAQTTLVIPQVALLSPSVSFSLPTLKGIALDAADPFKMNFIVEAGNNSLVQQDQIKQLTQYFLTFLTIPEKDLWVNLSPHESNRIITADLESTSVGRDMLVQDYILKQLAASLTYPDQDTGEKFWEQVSEKIKKKYGDINIPGNTFSKVWVVPEKAVVYEEKGSAFIGESRLKVMLKEEDTAQINQLYSGIAREVIIPELEREVNEGRHFAQLRQMFNSLILAVWFKRHLEKNIVNVVYSDQKKISGIELDEKKIGEKVYAQYMNAIKKGVYNIVREDYDPNTQKIIPKKYYSGGFSFGNSEQWEQVEPSSSFKGRLYSLFHKWGKSLYRFTVSLIPKGISKKSLLTAVIAAGLMAASMSIQAKAVETGTRFSNLPNSAHVVKADHVSFSERFAQFKAEHGEDIQKASENLDQNYVRHLEQGDYDVVTDNGVQETELKANLETLGESWNKVKSDATEVVALQEFLGVKADGKIGSLQTDPRLKQAAEEVRNAPTAEASESRVIPALENIANVHQTVQEQIPTPEITSTPTAMPTPEVKQAPRVAPAPQITRAPQVTLAPIFTPVPKVAQVTNVLPTSVPTPVDTVTTISQISKQTNIVGSPCTSPECKPDRDSTVLPFAFNQPYVFFGGVHAILDDGIIKSPAGGIIRGLDGRKTYYNNGSRVLLIVPEKMDKEREALLQQKIVEERRLNDLKQLRVSGSATDAEINPVQTRINELEQKLAQMDQEIFAIDAPCALGVNGEILVSEGMTIRKGTEVFKYLNHERIRITLKENLPSNITYLGNMKLRINTEPVKNIDEVRLQPNPEKNGTIASFVVIPASPISAGEVQMHLEILPPNISDNNFASVQEQYRGLSSIHHLTERRVPVSADGTAKRFVNPGDSVKAGQVIGRIELEKYQEQLKTAISTYNSIQKDLNLASQDAIGIVHITRDKSADLEAKKASVLGEIKAFQTQISRLTIVSPINGIVSDVSWASSFKEGDEFVRIKTGEAIVGDMDKGSSWVILPKSLNLKEGDPVLFETLSGQRLPGKIMTAPDQTPQSIEMNLGNDVQAVQITIYDEDLINNGKSSLGENLPGSIIVPAENDKEKIKSALKRIDEKIQENDRQYNESLKRQQPEALVYWEDSAHSETPVNQPAITHSTLVPQGQRVTVEDVAKGVGGNFLQIGDLTLEVLQKQSAEKLPDAVSVALQGNIIFQNGKLTYSGGLNAVYQGVTAGISTGNAYAAALPIIYQVEGNLVSLISGQKVKEKELALLRTEIAQHHMEKEVASLINKATALLIDIGREEQQINILKDLVSDLEKALGVSTAREAGGFSSSANTNAIRQQIENTHSQILELEKNNRQSAIELNNMIGSGLKTEISPVLHWDGQFPVLGADLEQKWQDWLMSDHSANYTLREAQALLRAILKTCELQRQGDLPSADLLALYLSGSASNPQQNIVSGEMLKVPSAGGNTVFGVRIPIPKLPFFTTKEQINEQIISQEEQRARLHLDSIKQELQKQFVETISELRDLSRQIIDAQSAYQTAYESWRQKAIRTEGMGASGESIYTQDALYNERVHIAQMLQKGVDLKAQYLKAEEKIREMGLLKPDQTIVKPSAGKSGLETVPSRSYQNKEKLLAMPSSPNRLSSGGKNHGPSEFLSAGVVILPADHEYWLTVMAQTAPGADDSRYNAIEQILMSQPDIRMRNQALDSFLEFQNDSTFANEVAKIVLKSPYPDVTQKLLLFMVDREDHDVRFFMSVINQSIKDKKFVLANLGFQIMSDMLTQDATIFDKLSELNIHNRSTVSRPISVEDSRKIWLNFMSRLPDDSLAKMRLLQGNYWNDDQLANIYNTLKLSQEPQAESLAKLIDAEILRRQKLQNIVEVFRLGPFQSPESIDVTPHYLYQKFAEENRAFLSTSPQWNEPGDWTFTDLNRRAKTARDNLISGNPAPESSGELLYHFAVPHGEAGDPLTYFKNLGLDAQKEYIARTKNSSELMRIAVFSSSLRGKALERLMKTPADRILVLQAYADSKDDELCKLIEQNRNWRDVIKADIEKLASPVVTDIIRRSMEKMYGRIHEDWPLNLRLATFTYPEIHALTDPRGESLRQDRANQMATMMALDLIGERQDHQLLPWVRWFGQLSAKEVRVIEEVRKIIKLSDDPQNAGRYLESQSQSADQDIRKITGKIINQRDKLAQRIVNNDQRLPRVPWWTGMVVGTLAVGTFGFFGWKNIRRSQIKHAKTKNKIIELRNELLPEGPLKYGAVDEKCGINLKNWEEIVAQWGGPISLPPREFVHSLNTVMVLAEEILRWNPYTEKLMWDEEDLDGHVPNEKYDKIYKYFIWLAVKTKDNMNLQLVNNNFDGYQKKEIQNAIDKLTCMIEHARKFAVILEARWIFDNDASYKFREGDIQEKIYWLPRKILGYSYKWTKAKEILNREVPLLLDQGESLMPGLYGDKRPKIIEDSELLLEKVIREAKKFVSFGSKTMQEAPKKRRFRSRALTILGFSLPFIGAIAGSFFGVPLVISFSILSLP